MELELEGDGSAGTFRCAFSEGKACRAVETALTIKGNGESCFCCCLFCRFLLCCCSNSSRRRSPLNRVKSTVLV